MFSTGNIAEKLRFGQLVQPGEHVVDLYCGIGYFALPALVLGLAQHVYCCEWNPVAVEYLQYNLRQNGIAEDRFSIFAGDCRQFQLRHADRVSLGLLPSSQGGWRTAVACLHEQRGGWLHVHGNVPVTEINLWTPWVCRQLHDIWLELQLKGENADSTTAVSNSWITLCTHVEQVKSFAPNVYHCVADVYMGPRLQNASALLEDPPNNAAPLSGHQLNMSILRDLPKNFTVAVFIGSKGTYLHPGASAAEFCMGYQSCHESCAPPSCALSTEGVLHQEWMR
jgi:Met-10+ like-protein